MPGGEMVDILMWLMVALGMIATAIIAGYLTVPMVMLYWFDRQDLAEEGDDPDS